MSKSSYLLATIEELRRRIGAEAFVAVDHWPADRNAIGLASPTDQQRLVYVSVHPDWPNSFFLSLEAAPNQEWAALPYTPLGEKTVEGLAALESEVAAHLGYAA